MDASFQPDPAFEAASVFVADWPLCHVRLQDDVRFPWLILIPRRGGQRELEDLSASDRAGLMEEVIFAGGLVRQLGEAVGRPVHKLNVAALGNVTAQLHVHVIGRRPDDGEWPEPVWGRGERRAYGSDAREQALSLLRTG